MTKIDRWVMVVVGAILGAFIVRTALEAAVSLLIPVLVLAAGYGAYRAWQLGVFKKLGRLKDDVKETG